MKLPLVVQKSLGCSWLEDSGFNHVADYLTDENAQTIAHRVNMHDELVAALEGSQKALRKALPRTDADGDAHYVGEWLETVSAALERAKQ
jgi:c-di-GMP-related signal transduction protein